MGRRPRFSSRYQDDGASAVRMHPHPPPREKADSAQPWSLLTRPLLCPWAPSLRTPREAPAAPRVSQGCSLLRFGASLGGSS